MQSRNALAPVSYTHLDVYKRQAYDPAVAAARDIAGNPSSVLGSLADYYSGCTTAEVTTPAGTTSKVCNRYSGVGNYTTRRDLTVQVKLLPSCAEATWFAHGQVNRNGMDYMLSLIHS